MTFPLQIEMGKYSINSHLLFETIGYIIGFRYYLFLRKKESDPIPDRNRISILIGAVFGAFLFSRLLGSLENTDAWIHSEYPFLYFFGNKTIIGGLLGGLIGVELAKVIIGEKNSSGDLFTFPIILAMIIGRIGCFTSGISEPTYGIETSFILGMDLGDGLFRHPTSLYEALYLTALLFSLKFLKRRYSFTNGTIFKLFMILYLLFRFLIDFIKPGIHIWPGISPIQIFCILGLLYYTKTIYYLLFSRGNLLTYEQNR